jgi:methionine sulfoxide reductase heme-binding subunit
LVERKGWQLVGWVTFALAAMSAAIVLSRGAGEDAWRSGIRATARSSIALFLIVFAARPWNKLWPSPASKWTLRNRRYLGVSLFMSQVVHAIFIGLLIAQYPASFWAGVKMSTVVGGAFGYLLLLLMALTSFDRTAALIGKRAWKILHTLGMYYVWIVFASSYGPRAAHSPLSAVFAVLLLAALVLRLAALKK